MIHKWLYYTQLNINNNNKYNNKYDILIFNIIFYFIVTEYRVTSYIWTKANDISLKTQLCNEVEREVIS